MGQSVALTARLQESGWGAGQAKLGHNTYRLTLGPALGDWLGGARLQHPGPQYSLAHKRLLSRSESEGGSEGWRRLWDPNAGPLHPLFPLRSTRARIRGDFCCGGLQQLSACK